MRAAVDKGLPASPKANEAPKAARAKNKKAGRGTKRPADVSEEPTTAISGDGNSVDATGPLVSLIAQGALVSPQSNKKSRSASATSPSPEGIETKPTKPNDKTVKRTKAVAKDTNAASKAPPGKKKAKVISEPSEKLVSEEVADVDAVKAVKGKKLPTDNDKGNDKGKGKKRAAPEPPTKATDVDDDDVAAIDPNESCGDGDEGSDRPSARRRGGALSRKAAMKVKSYNISSNTKDGDDDGDDDMEETIKVKEVKDAATEEEALRLTSSLKATEAGHVRSLGDFVLVDSEGRAEPLDRLGNVQGGLFLSGVIEPLRARSETRSKAKGATGQVSQPPPATAGRCKAARIGPIKEWRLKYSAGADPKIVLHTDLAQYECGKPTPSYRKLLEPLMAQVELAAAVHQALCTGAGGRMDTSFDDVCRRVARTKVSKQYGGARFALKLNGRFLLEQLAAMSRSSKPQEAVGAKSKEHEKGKTVPVGNGGAAAATSYTYENGPFAQGLRQAMENEDHMPISKDALVKLMGRDAGGIRIATDGGGGGESGADGGAAAAAGNSAVDDDYELACRLMAEEYAVHMNGGGHRASGARRRGGAASGSKELYIQVRVEEIADDYPEPKEYKVEEDQDEWDELILEDPELLGCGFHGADEREGSRTLDQFAIYNADGFLTTLELVPMVAGLDANVNIFASGVLADETGDWGAEVATAADGIQIQKQTGAGAAAGGSGADGSGTGSGGGGGQRYFLTQIREWLVECGPGGDVVINIRTDVSWYRLVRPQKRYAPWFRVVQRVANIAVQVLTWLDEQDRAARLSFSDIVARLATLPAGHTAYISAKVDVVERFVVVHGQVILNLIGQHYKESIRRCGFAKTLRSRLTERRHRKLATGGGKKGFHIAKTGVVENPVKIRQARQTKKSDPMPATSTAKVRQVWSEYFNALDEIQLKQRHRREQELLQQEAKKAEEGARAAPGEAGKDVTADVGGGAANTMPTTAARGVDTVAAVSTALTVFRVPKVESKTWTLTERKSKDKKSGRTMYGAAVCGDLRLNPGSVIRLGSHLTGAAAVGSDDDDEEEEEEEESGSESDVSNSGDESAEDAAAAAGEEGSGGVDAAAAAARRWEVLTRGPFALVQCIFTEAGDNDNDTGKGKAEKGSSIPKLQIRRLVHGRDTMLGDVAAPSELFLLDRTAPPAVPPSRGGGGVGDVGDEVTADGGVRRLVAARGDVAVMSLNGRTVGDVLEARLLNRTATHYTRLEDGKADLERVKQDAERVAAGRPPVFVYRTVYCPLQGKFRELRVRDLDLGSYVEVAPTPPSLELLPGSAGFIKDGVTYRVGEFLYVRANAVDTEEHADSDSSDQDDLDSDSDSADSNDELDSDDDQNSSSEEELDEDEHEAAERRRRQRQRQPRCAAVATTAATAAIKTQKQRQRQEKQEEKGAAGKKGVEKRRTTTTNNASKKKKDEEKGKTRRCKEDDEEDDDGRGADRLHLKKEDGGQEAVEMEAAEKDENGFKTKKKNTTHKGSNQGLRPFAVVQLWAVVQSSKEVSGAACTADKGVVSKGRKGASSSTSAPFTIQVRRFYRPEDISRDVAYGADWWDLYAPAATSPSPSLTLSVGEVYGKCAVVIKSQSHSNHPSKLDTFHVVGSYDPRQPTKISLPPTSLSTPPSPQLAAAPQPPRSKAPGGKAAAATTTATATADKAEGEDRDEEGILLDTLDIFAGCGGLSEGMHQAGVANTRWAIEYDSEAAGAFQLNNPEAKVFCNNCNVLLRAAMLKAGLEADCFADATCVEAAGKLDEAVIADLPTPGSVALMMGGPPCQGYSGMNRFNKGLWSQVQNSMVMAYLSFCDFYRPRYFLLENVRNFAVYRGGEVFRLVVRTLLDLGYQVRFGILNAGHYGAPQSRKRTFIWAALPGEVLPDWPTPRHVFVSAQLGLKLDHASSSGSRIQESLVPGGGYFYASGPPLPGAPLRCVTVHDAIGDLPAISNDAKEDVLPYTGEPKSAYQRAIRGSAGSELRDHIVKQMNELNLERCRCIPKGVPGADWRVLQKIVAEDPTREFFKGDSLVPFCLPNTADRHNGWRGLYGRLDPDGHFPTATTEPNPMGKVGQVFHPNQDRIVSVRECARSQGFPDHFRFHGNVICRHRQVGNAVPPPLARALGQQLRIALKTRRTQERQEAADRMQALRNRRQQ